ncbi:MAG: UDP-N-acetylmuramoyl-tripeptide--D-alanyl-D-alanine ligase [Anaerolineaceae bacterium]
MFTLGDVIEALTGRRLLAASFILNEAVIDSRHVIPGSLFIAMPGERTDGHSYVDEAFKQGATVAVIQQDIPGDYPVLDLRNGADTPIDMIPQTPFCLRVENSLAALQKIAGFWRRKLDLRVIGITGSVGKSTTKEMVAEVLNERFVTLKNTGNLNNEIGLPLTLLRLSEGHQRAVLEMGFYVPGEIAFLCELAQPQVGVITNIGTVHAERAGSRESIALGKSELIQALPPAPTGSAILNYDDPLVRPMAGLTRAHVVYYGLDPEADLWADQIESVGLEGIRFRLHYQKDTLHIRVPLIGRHSVHTVLRAAAVGLVEHMSWAEIVAGLQTSQTQLRMAAVHTENGAMLLDDTYNASPESTLAALNLLSEMSGRKIAVLGDMLELGQYEIHGHELVGIRAAQTTDLLVTIGERGATIARAAKEAGLPSNKILSFNDVQEVVGYLKENLKEGDVALVKGSHSLRLDRIISALEETS